MPSHQERREPLPKGYQFGDSAPWEVRFNKKWREAVRPRFDFSDWADDLSMMDGESLEIAIAIIKRMMK